MEEIIINPDYKKDLQPDKPVTPTVSKHVTYRHAVFHRRVLANLIDFILFIIAFISIFLGIRGIVSSTPKYQKVNQEVETVQRESALYKKVYTTGKILDVVAYWNIQDSAASSKAWQLNLAIYDFLNYCDDACSKEDAKMIRDSYDEYRSKATYTYEVNDIVKEVHLFIKDGDDFIENPDVNKKYVTRDVFYKYGYAPFIENYALGYLITCVPNYYENTRYLSNVLLAEIIPSYPVAGLLIYLIPPLIFKRGRKTIGKLIYQIGLLDERNCYNPKLGRTIARQCIVVFAELCLSIFTLCAPCIVSFSMMAFSKKKQGFPDYMLGLREVDTSDNKIYYNEDEIIKELVHKSAGPVEFNLPKNDF